MSRAVSQPVSDELLDATGGRDVYTVRFPVADPPDQVDVLVVGAGPVGLSAAIELDGRGVDVAVVDAASQATLARAGAMGHTPRVVEHFRRWGVLQRIRDGWTFPPEWDRGIRFVTSLAGHELATHQRRGFDESAGSRFSLAGRIRRPQTALQQAFLDHLRDRSVSVAGGWTAVALRQDDDGVETTVVNAATGQSRRIRSRYLIGADGGRSTVRRLVGVTRRGDYADEKMFRLVVRTGDLSDVLGPAPSSTNIVVNQHASGFLAAISTRLWRVYSKPYPLDVDPPEDELLATARAAFGFEVDLELESKTSFYQATRIAETFRAGRVLLAGDAAHVRAPGGNLGDGFGDVVNLGWKLAAVLAGHGSDALLDSYDHERRPHNWRIGDFALQRARRGRENIEATRRIGVPDDADTSPAAALRRAEIGAALGRDQSEAPGVVYDERYDASDVIWYEDNQLAEEAAWRADRYVVDPRPGHRAPDGYVDPWGDTLYDRIGNRFALLVLRHSGDVERAFVAEASARALPFTVVHLVDPQVRDLYGVDHVLVRPDQHVAWRGGTLPAGGAAAVLDVVLGHGRPGRVQPVPARYTEAAVA